MAELDSYSRKSYEEWVSAHKNSPVIPPMERDIISRGVELVDNYIENQHKIKAAAYGASEKSLSAIKIEYEQQLMNKQVDAIIQKEIDKRTYKNLYDARLNPATNPVYDSKTIVRKSKMVVTYKVVSGTNILIPPQVDGPNSMTAFWEPGFTISQCHPIRTSKTVVYDEGDVCYNPQTKRVVPPFPKDMMAASGARYFCFVLPTNDKGVPVIFVDKDSVFIIHDEHLYS